MQDLFQSLSVSEPKSIFVLSIEVYIIIIQLSIGFLCMAPSNTGWV